MLALKVRKRNKRVNIKRGSAARTWFLALCLVYSDAINASEKVSDVRFTRRAAVKNDCGTWPNLPLTFKEPIIWREVGESVSAGGGMREIKRMLPRTRVEKAKADVQSKRKINKKTKKQTRDIWHQTGLIRRPLLEITKPINRDRFRLLWSFLQATS